MSKSRIFKTLVSAFLFAGALSAQATDSKDPNVTTEGDKSSVTNEACIAYGGTIGSDKRYFVCNGGKYDGMITSKEKSEDPVPFCAQNVLMTERLIDDHGTVEDEEQFVAASSSTLKLCQLVTPNWEAMQSFISAARQVCDESRDQRSDLYLGTCYHKAARLVVDIL